jgi:hypothetical protein
VRKRHSALLTTLKIQGNMRETSLTAAQQMLRIGPKAKEEIGADGRTRTGDMTLTKRLLYQLSYIGGMRTGHSSRSWGGQLRARL